MNFRSDETARGWTYILASKRDGTLYTGSTTDLIRRVYEHREKLIGGFTAKYNVTHLVWFEGHVGIVEAANRERQIKRWRRQWKIELIEGSDPEWRDLWDKIAT